MKRLGLLFAACGLMGFAPSLLAQEIPHTCGADEVRENHISQDPSYQLRIAEFEEAYESYISEPGLRAAELFTIPVVIHVIHEGEAFGEGSNISDEQVMSAIVALNEDFRKMEGTNGDGDGADIEIEFCLAQRDPDGNPSNGINRVDGSSVPNYAEEGIQATGSAGADEMSIKNLSIWPRADYMNVWVVNEIENNDAQNGIQGYAYFPVNNPVDGIVMLHNAFGTVGNLKFNTDMNRTFSHEVGHYLALYHTFHTTSACDSETNCATQGDRVCDTPPTVLSGSCINPACSGTQQIENYMDYTPETCRNMFSEGQKLRMRAAVELERISLLSSLGCAPVSALDCGISQVVSPAGASCNTQVSPQIVLTNFGSQAISTVEIVYGIDGSGQSFNWTGNLASGGSTTISLPSFEASNGAHTFEAIVQNPNGGQDNNTSNDSASSEFEIAPGATVNLTIEFDYFGTETSWLIKDTFGNVTSSGGPYSGYTQGDQVSLDICLPEGCYDLEMVDAFGDGQSLSYGNYTLLDQNGEQVAFGEDDWGGLMIHNFCVTVNENPDPPIAAFSCEQSICFGESLSIVQSAQGSIDQASWTFEDGTPSTFQGLNPPNILFTSAGNKTISFTVSNSEGSHTATQEISVGSEMIVALEGQDPTCIGQSDGIITSSVSGGSAPYTYQWSNGSSAPSLSGIEADNYILFVTDANGCEAISEFDLTAPSNLTLELSIENVSCFGEENGAASCEVFGGVGNETIIWNTGATGATLENLAAGVFSVSVSNANGCEINQSFEVTEPAALVLDLMVNNQACGSEAGGNCELSINGGVAPYQILWDGLESGAFIDNISVGTHNLEVIDNNGCSATQTFQIENSENLNLSPNIVSISCSGLEDGSITINPNGGDGNYSILWENGATTPSISGLGAGSYSVEVMDGSGCVANESYEITNPAPLELAIFKQDIGCFGKTDGIATATASGGNEPYTYSWSNGATSAQLFGLEAGSYTLTVTDNTGCSASETIFIVEPSELTSSTVLGNAETCAGNDGSAWVNVLGGTGGYSYQWSNGSNTSLINNVPSGSYSILITDDNGCTSTSEVEIPYDCDAIIPTTHLVDNDCGASDLLLEHAVHCEPIVGAEMYEWRFTNVVEGGYTEVFTLGGITEVYLWQVSNLEYGKTYGVEVRSVIAGQWSAFGILCYISMANEPMPIFVSTADCDKGSVPMQSAIHTTEAQGANKYEWTFVSEDVKTKEYSSTPELYLDSGSGIVPDKNYDVSVRAEVGEVWTPEAESCQLRILSVENLALNPNENITIFPNPGNGQQIFLEFTNPFSEDPVLDIEVFDVHGKRVSQFYLLPSGPRSELEYQFSHPLGSGLYVMKITYNDFSVEKKWLVQ